MYQDAVKVPIGDWAKDRLKNLSKTDKIRDNAKNGSGFGKNVSNWVGKETVYPTNVVHLATNVTIKITVPLFQENYPNGLLSYSQKKTTPY